jgi:hypothetical protein
MLARLRVAFGIFRDIALTLSSFKNVAITLVPGPPKPDRHPMGDLNFRQTLGLLQLDSSPATIKVVLGQNSTVAKMEREFDKRQKQKPSIHAEVQLLMFLLSFSEELASEIVPYFGCSKLCCFVCA